MHACLVSQLILLADLYTVVSTNLDYTLTKEPSNNTSPASALAVKFSNNMVPGATQLDRN